jgi:hypothetical protein
VLIHCLACGGGLDEVSETTGIPRWRLLKSPPPKELGPPVSDVFGRQRGRVEPPSEGTVAGWHSALMSNTGALRYLRTRRGLSKDTIERYQLGYSGDRDAVVVPIREANGDLHSAYFRSLNPLATRGKRNLARPAALFPLAIFADSPQFVVLCEGEFDALLLNQHGVPAITSTSGTGGWEAHADWGELFVGLHVAVLYDVGSFELAKQRAHYLKKRGARDAWAVSLPLATGEDVTNWFVDYVYPVGELKAVIGKFRRLHRRGASGREGVA